MPLAELPLHTKYKMIIVFYYRQTQLRPIADLFVFLFLFILFVVCLLSSLSAVRRVRCFYCKDIKI